MLDILNIVFLPSPAIEHVSILGNFESQSVQNKDLKNKKIIYTEYKSELCINQTLNKSPNEDLLVYGV